MRISAKALAGLVFGMVITSLALAAPAEPGNPPANPPETCAQAKAAVAKSFEDIYAGSHASLLIQRDERLLVEKNIGEKITRKSRFLLASITKSLHGAAASRLAVKKILTLDDPILPDLPPELAFTRPESWSRLKIRNLLHHTSGIADYLDGEFDELLKFPRNLMFLVGLLPRPLEFEPDTRFKYSNTNYLLLSWIMQKRTALSDHDLLAREVWEPFDQTVYLPDANVTQIFTPDPACHGEGCDRYGLGFALRPNGLEGYTWALHRGNLDSTSTVIAKVPDVGLDMVLLSDRGGVDNEVLARDSLARLIRAKCARTLAR
jgi:CubicO group peptidase (beta-lactamase class C family)